MKKISFTFVLLISMLVLCSCYTTNPTYQHNKAILDTYPINPNYGILTRFEYQENGKKILYKNKVLDRIRKDGNAISSSTRYGQELTGNHLYFCCEYNSYSSGQFNKYAMGYFELETNALHLSYFVSENIIFKYVFSTNQYICYCISDIHNKNNVYVVYFKETGEIAYDYDIKQLSYKEEDIEETKRKDYYIENGIKYKVATYERTLANEELGLTIHLPSGEELFEKAPIVKEIYDQFEYEYLSLSAYYISMGDELFFYIDDRPTNVLNAPYMIFKCDATFTNVTYIGYAYDLIEAVVKRN